MEATIKKDQLAKTKGIYIKVSILDWNRIKMLAKLEGLTMTKHMTIQSLQPISGKVKEN